jgi:hypothetical protein
LHFPVYFSAAAFVGVLAAVVLPGPVTVALAVFVLAAAVHSAMDVFGGGLEARPWLATSDEGVYSHYHGVWIAPRRWIRYDGAPEDLALATVLAVPLLGLVDRPAETLIVAAVVISAAYAAVRKQLPDVEAALHDAMPQSLLDRLPDGVLRAES